jgi:putative IMPACT (imprinted ancient) family translation regulator
MLVTNICVVVIRYFGGVKLGAGGLIRAYGTSTNQLLSKADTVEVRAKSTFIICGDYHHEPVLRHWLENRGGCLTRVCYEGNVRFFGELDKTLECELEAFVAANRMALLDV